MTEEEREGGSCVGRQEERDGGEVEREGGEVEREEGEVEGEGGREGMSLLTILWTTTGHVK